MGARSTTRIGFLSRRDALLTVDGKKKALKIPSGTARALRDAKRNKKV